MSSTHTTRDSSTLERLPPEIQTLILKRMPNVKTLQTLIQSSPRFLQVYLGFQEAILSQVTCNHITPALLPLAIMALEQHRRRRTMVDVAAVLAFMKEFRQQGSPATSSYSFSLETSRALLQFHKCVEYFVSAFAENRLQVIETYLQHLGEEAPTRSSLSPIEHHRISRAFYHMDIYGHLFHRQWDDLKLWSTTKDQEVLFLQRLDEWEVEEFLGVKLYLFEKLTAFLNQVEDDCVHDYVNNGPYRIESVTRGRWRNNDIFFSSRHTYFRHLWTEGCLTRGLRKLKVMLAASTFSDKLAALGDTIYQDEGFDRAVKKFPTYPAVPGSAQQVHNYPETSDIENSNEGWRWLWNSLELQQLGHNISHCPEFIYNRKWGYMMWDRQRLSKMGILAKHPRDVANSCQYILGADLNESTVELRTRTQEQVWDKAGLILPENRDYCSPGWLFRAINEYGNFVVPPNF